MSQYSNNRGKTPTTTVYLNVYDLSENNNFLYPFGFGAHHSGIQLGQREYTYAGGSGIYSTAPLDAPGAVFRETIELGRFTGSAAQLDSIIDGLRADFPPNGYNILTRNCNTFAEAFAAKLCPNNKFPAHVNRLASVGSLFSCCLPPDMVEPPPGGGSGSGSSNDSNNFGAGGSVYGKHRQQQQRNSTSNPMSVVAFSGAGNRLGGGTGQRGNPYRQQGLQPMNVN